MNGNIRVGNLFGIPFFINPSWFLVVGLMTLSYGSQLANFEQLPGVTPWLLGLVASLLLFASVVAHELGHSFVAIAQGVQVKSITLFLFGGLASLEKESDTPLQALLVAIAGPGVSLLLFGLFATVNASLALPAPLSAIVTLLASLNLILALFNLIPGLPLDGGNVVKALVWQVTGNPNKGVLFASRAGQFFGWLAVILGGLAILGISNIGNFWTLLIGWFLLQNAGFSAQSAKVQDTLSGLTAEEAMIPDTPLVNANLNLRQFANDYVIGQTRWRKFLVINEEAQLVGSILSDDLKTIGTSQWTEVSVRELTQPLASEDTVPASLSLLEVVKQLDQSKNPQLAVVRDDGTTLGLIEKSAVIKFLQKRSAKPATES